MISPQIKRYLLKILPFGFISMVLSIVYSLLEKGILGNHEIYPSTGNPYSFNPLLPSVISFFVGLIIGIIEVFYLSRIFKRSSFAKKIIFKTIIYFGIVISSVFIISTLSTAHELALSPLNSKVLKSISIFFSSFALWSVLSYFTLGILVCLFFLEISDNIGQNVILNFFSGKYHKPKEEQRIFMFLDMRSSTSIAEKLGHTEYFNLLNDYYSDLSSEIIKYNAEIYQYVGDEIVLTWKLDEKSRDSNCINCFFAMQETLRNKKESYLLKYNIMPDFKAAIHSGNVTTGEIGEIKKDIVYTGDVLNTAARIQGLCNYYKAELLASKKLIKSLNLSKYNVTEIGEVDLKGKNKRITIYKVQQIKSF